MNPCEEVNTRGQKILVVEDEAHITRLLQVNLQRAGYEVITTSSGQAAIALACPESPDLVIIDQTLPDMTGDALARSLASLPPVQVPALLLMFPKGVQAEWVEGWIKPANAYITKPFYPQELIRFVQNILAETRRLRDLV